MERPFPDRNNREVQNKDVGESIDELWDRIGEILKSKGVSESNVVQLIAQIRWEKKTLSR
jgi:hypothetical protein